MINEDAARDSRMEFEDDFLYVDGDEDITLLKVMGRNKDGTPRKGYTKKLATAILQVLDKHGIAKLRAVGDSAIHNAQSALAIAGYRAKRMNGRDLVETTRFTEVDFGNGDPMPAIIKNAFYLEPEND